MPAPHAVQAGPPHRPGRDRQASPRWYSFTPPSVSWFSELGATAEQECQVLIAQSDIMSKPAGDAQSRAARRLLRHEWQPTSPTAQAIETAVAELLSDPA